MLKHLVAFQLEGFLKETDILDPFQSGFRPSSETVADTVTLVDDLRRATDTGHAFLLVPLDLSVAFNIIDYCILLSNLLGMEIGVGTNLSWCCSFPERRLQKKLLRDNFSIP